MRGRLIYPFNVAYRQLDISSSTYDHDLLEPATTDDGSQLGVDGRVESALIYVPGQIEDDFFEERNMMLTGDSPDSEYIIVHHFRDLENKFLVDVNGNALIKKGDRVEAVYDYLGNVVFTPQNPPGLYVSEVTPEMGLYRRRNLLIVKVIDREVGVQG